MVASWVAVQSTWLEIELDGIFKRVNFSRERGRSREREHFQEREELKKNGEFKRAKKLRA